jgi:hypothetical protein
MEQFGIKASDITHCTALINWFSKVVFTGQIEYGTTSLYGSKTAPQVPVYNKPNGKYSISVLLKNLSPSTTYHYRVIGISGDSLITKSTDQTFTTLPLTLLAGTRYPIRLETKNCKDVALSWASDSVSKQIIPQACLIPAILTDLGKGYPLMEGLPYNAALNSETNGWRRYPTINDLTNRYSQYWVVQTNVKTYNPFQTPDVYAQYRKGKGEEAMVTRDLGGNPSAKWNLSGKITYEGNVENQDEVPVFTNSGTGGQFFDVLDDNANLIFRMFVYLNPATGISTIYANGVALTQGTQTRIRQITSQFCNFSLTENNGLLQVTFANCPTQTIPLASTVANYSRPQTMRLYFWTKNSNTDRRIAIKDFLFKKG